MTSARSLSFISLVLFATIPPAPAADEIDRICGEVGAPRGICVVLAESPCDLPIQLAERTEMLIYMQLPTAEAVTTAREAADAKGFNGTRIFIREGPLSTLYLADNTTDIIVAAQGDLDVNRREIMRVLRPKGKALMGGRVLVKPFPEGVDDWSHPYHGPDNNPQSHDQVIVKPYLTQFLSEPRYAPLPQVAVASAGRVFKAYGHVAFKEREEPLLNKLVAYNGYNGTMLWQRDLREGYMIHRNTMIATPKKLYIADDQSCKVVDTATGELEDEITPPVDIARGTCWKWMAFEDGILYALIGRQEQKDESKRWKRDKHGWPWHPISPGFHTPQTPWGYGRTLLAIDPRNKEVLWHYHENEPVDGRAICMKDGRIYAFSFGSYLTCIDAKTGRPLWRKTPQNARRLFDSLGDYSHRQDWRTNWRTTCYLKCSDAALYFAGPQVNKLLVVSAADGEILWENPYNNYQLVLRGDVIYGISGQIDNHPSTKFSALTGETLAQIRQHRRACTRPSGSVDAIFCRAEGGSIRFDVATNRPEWISPMRAQCHDGVTIANGLLYWWPSVCDCHNTLYGITTLGPAGDFNFEPDVPANERLEIAADGAKPFASLQQSSADWPTFRADNQCSATSKAVVPNQAGVLWTHEHTARTSDSFVPVTPPVVVGGLVFVGGSDGVVKAIDTDTGELAWKQYTGGCIRIPPTIWKNRAFVGSGDGCVYCFDARTGRRLWRFRAAPKERMMSVYGLLMSTWPTAAGVLVEDGIAYVAAGLANYDGTYIYALDATTGRVKWQNVKSGHLNVHARTGVSVQGHMLLNAGRLFLAGGTSVSPAVYEADSGKCLNDASHLAECVARCPRGWELTLLGGEVAACGKPFYAHPKYDVYDATVFDKIFVSSAGGRHVAWLRTQYGGKIVCFEDLNTEPLKQYMSNPGNRFHLNYGKVNVKDRPQWTYDCPDSIAWAVCRNAVLTATNDRVSALSLADGKQMWGCPLPAAPITWGMAVEKEGRVIVTLENGQVVCLGPNKRI